MQEGCGGSLMPKSFWLHTFVPQPTPLPSTRSLGVLPSAWFLRTVWSEPVT